MEKIKELTNYIENEVKFLFNDEYSSIIDEVSIQVFSDNKNSIDITNERLKPYFNSLSKNKFINIYTLKAEKVTKLIKNICFNKLKWRQVKHMGGYFYNSVNEEFSVSIWVDKNYKYFDDSSLKIEQLIKSKDINIIIKKVDKFFYLYNDNNTNTTLRLVRSLLMRPFLNNKWIYFHTSAIRYKNKAILLCGNSGNGKTSTLLHFLNSKSGGQLIANDRVFIGIKDNKVKVFGWDSVVTLGVGVLNKYKQLRRYLTNIDDITCNQDLYGYSPKNEYLNLSSFEMKNLKSKGNKLAITHKHLVELFNTKIIPCEDLSAIVNINLKWECKNKKLTQLHNNDKISVLNDNILDNVSDQLGWIGYPILNNDTTIFKDIISSVDFYKYKSDFQDFNLTSFLDEVI